SSITPAPRSSPAPIRPRAICPSCSRPESWASRSRTGSSVGGISEFERLHRGGHGGHGGPTETSDYGSPVSLSSFLRVLRGEKPLILRHALTIRRRDSVATSLVVALRRRRPLDAGAVPNTNARRLPDRRRARAS